jgi:hypothetical protein
MNAGIDAMNAGIDKRLWETSDIVKVVGGWEAA